jgi:hypothetical protein
MWQVFRRPAGAQFTPVRGARVALAMLPPLVGIAVLGRTRGGSHVAVGALLGVLFVASCDLGSSLRIRAQAMAAGAVVGALLLGLGSWICGPWWVAVPTLAVTTFLQWVPPPVRPSHRAGGPHPDHSLRARAGPRWRYRERRAHGAGIPVRWDGLPPAGPRVIRARPAAASHRRSPPSGPRAARASGTGGRAQRLLYKPCVGDPPWPRCVPPAPPLSPEQPGEVA